MKKIILSILLLCITVTIYGCNNDSQKERFEMFFSSLDETITKDMVLPESFEDIPVSYYIDEKKVEMINFIYTNKSLSMTLEVVLETEEQLKLSKKINMSPSEMMHNLYITTEDEQEIVSKDDYINGKVSLESDGVFAKEDLEMRIKGRGNSTWTFPKKPYKIKFDERQSLLGMAEAKEYVLLAEYNDKSLMRNYAAHYFSEFLNFDRHLETRHVSLFINQEYQGVYLLTEQVEVDENKLNIDQSDLFYGGFLIELEADERVGEEGIEDIDWFRVDGRNFVIKSPDMEDYSQVVVNGKVNYMKDYLNNFLESIENDTYDEYIDVDSFIDYFILAEIFKQVDVGYSSVYAYKDVDSKLKMGPIWDFDISSGNGDYYDYGPEGYWVDYNPWFNQLIEKESFEIRYIRRFNEVVDLYFDQVITEIEYVSNALIPFASANFDTWDIMGTYVWPNPPEMVEADTYEKQIAYFKGYLSERVIWLENELNTKGYYKD